MEPLSATEAQPFGRASTCGKWRLAMSPVVVVAVVFTIPVTLVVCPAPVVVVVVRVAPVGARIGRTPPHSGDPHIPSPRPVPISVYPDKARTRNRGPNLIAQWQRSSADVYADLSEGWSRKYRSQD